MTADVWLLMSGGLDSTVCAHYFKQRGNSVTGIFVDYGQPAAEAERRAVSGVARHLRIPLTTLSFKADHDFGLGEILGRNAFLIFAALMGLQLERGILSLGIHAGTGYYDCGDEFVKTVGRVVDTYSAGRLVLHCPFLYKGKSFFYEYAMTEGIPIDLTYSCELGKSSPCESCLSCKDRNAFQTC